MTPPVPSSRSPPYTDNSLAASLPHYYSTRYLICYTTIITIPCSPTTLHLSAAHRILRYIKQAPRQGIFFPTKNTLQLKSFGDWASCPITRKLFLVFSIFLGSSLISWKSRKLSHFSPEAKYRSLTALTCELQWLMTYKRISTYQAQPLH